LNTVADRSREAFFEKFTSLPGESGRITTEVLDADTRGEKPRVVVEGFNVSGEK